jgi:hypothetical protein
MIGGKDSVVVFSASKSARRFCTGICYYGVRWCFVALPGEVGEGCDWIL